jgi:glutaredoxin
VSCSSSSSAPSDFFDQTLTPTQNKNFFSRPHRRIRERFTELDVVVQRMVIQDLAAKNDPQPELVVSISKSGSTSQGDDDKQTTVVIGQDEILSFLDETFTIGGETDDPTGATGDTKLQVLDIVDDLSNFVASWMRIGRGRNISPAALKTKPSKPLVLYSYEGNQFCRLVREVLTELDLPYELRSAGKGSDRRTELASLSGGSTQCPYLIDPNTGTQTSESKDIIRYLYKQYASWTPPNELLEWISENVMAVFKPIFAVTAPLQAGSRRSSMTIESDSDKYKLRLEQTIKMIEEEVASDSVVVYTYEWSPFSFETKALLDSIGVPYKEISLGKEWIPGLIDTNDGSLKRAALLEMTGQSSLPHIFVKTKPIGGLFSGKPGLLPLLKEDKISDFL